MTQEQFNSYMDKYAVSRQEKMQEAIDKGITFKEFFSNMDNQELLENNDRYKSLLAKIICAMTLMEPEKFVLVLHTGNLEIFNMGLEIGKMVAETEFLNQMMKEGK